MARVARPIDPRKIRFLKEQIKDPGYLQGAVDLLAGRITDRILGFDEKLPGSTAHRSESSSSIDIALLLSPAE